MASYLWSWQRAQPTVRPMNALLVTSTLSCHSSARSIGAGLAWNIQMPLPFMPSAGMCLSRTFSGSRSAASCALTNMS